MATYDIGAMKSSIDTEGLIEALKKSEDASIRCDAVKAIGQVGDSQTVSVLVDSLRDSDERVREAAINSLGRLGDLDTIDTIIPLIADSDEGIRHAAFEAMIQIKKGAKRKGSKRDRGTRSASAGEEGDRYGIGDWLYVAACLPAEHIETWYSDYQIQIMAGRIGLFLGGVILWGIAFWLLSSISNASGSSSDFSAILIVIPMIILFAMAMKGWDWYSEYKLGTNGHALKFIVMLFIIMTLVGIIPIVYWTGKGVAKTVFGE